jgi:predicted dehydrogenase
MSDQTTSGGVSRRDFMKTTVGTTTIAVAGSLMPQTVVEGALQAAPAINPRIIGANDRIHLGFIGVNTMGGRHLRNVVSADMAGDNVDAIAVCDVWETALRKAQATAGCPESQVFTDYRKLLELKDVDAVVVATPDHWHGAIGVDTLRASKHLYMEKPMTRRLEEAFEMQDAAKRSRRLVQVGSHGCSDPKYLQAREIVGSGVLGRLLWAQGSYCRNNPKGEWNYALASEANEQTVDWKAWLGPAPKHAWSAERFFRWRKYWDYGTGIIGDLWPHRLYPLVLAMDLKEFPRSVSCLGGDLCNTDAGPGPDGKPYGERRDVADTTMMMVEFPSGVMIFLAGATTNERGIEDVIRGHRGNLSMGGNRLEITPERPFVDELEAGDRTPPDAGESHVKHMRNFLQSIRSNTAPNCNEDLGVRVQAVVSMAEAAYRNKTLVRFDEKTRRLLT